jgi:hypothetical protein
MQPRRRDLPLQPPADRHEAFTDCYAEAFGYVAFVGGKAQAAERFGDAARPAG